MMRAARPTTLILGAMPSEVRVIQAELVGRKSGTLACFPYDTGRLHGRNVIVAVTGVGVTNGAMVAALFVERFAPAELLVSGTGSRFNARVRTGDTVISTKTIHHAAGSLTDDGMVYRNVRGPLRGQMTAWFYRPDRALLTLAKAAIRSYAAQPITVDGQRYTPAVFPGVVTASEDRRYAGQAATRYHGNGKRGDRASLPAAGHAAHRVSGRQQSHAIESRQ
jgi:adenosylhomocysteine nucleosidase